MIVWGHPPGSGEFKSDDGVVEWTQGMAGIVGRGSRQPASQDKPLFHIDLISLATIVRSLLS